MGDASIYRHPHVLWIVLLWYQKINVLWFFCMFFGSQNFRPSHAAMQPCCPGPRSFPGRIWTSFFKNWSKKAGLSSWISERGRGCRTGQSQFFYWFAIIICVSSFAAAERDFFLDESFAEDIAKETKELIRGLVGKVRSTSRKHRPADCWFQPEISMQVKPHQRGLEFNNDVRSVLGGLPWQFSILAELKPFPRSGASC